MKLALFLISCLMAFLAGHMVNYSIIFISLEQFHSHQLAGLGYALCFGPPIILGWYAGVLCDRYSPRRVILLLQNSYLISLLLIYIGLNSRYQIELTLLAGFFSGVGWSFVAPARFATLAYYVSNDKLSQASIALNLMVMTGFGLAPMLVKALLSGFDWHIVLAVTAGLLVVSSTLLWPLRFSFTPQPKGKTFKELKASWAFVRQSKPLMQLMALAVIAYLLMGPMQVLLPSIARDTLHLSDAAQGHYLSIVAYSLIVGGLLTMVLRAKIAIGHTMFATIALAGAGLGSLAMINSLTLSAIVLALAGVAGGSAISLIVAGLQHYTPSEYRGRIMSMYTIIGQFIPAVSGLMAGALAGFFNFGLSLMIMAGILLVTLMSAFSAFGEIKRVKQYQMES